MGNFRIVNDALGMGTALMRHCQPEQPTFQTAALAVLQLSKGEIDPEEARDAFFDALEAVGVFVRGVARNGFGGRTS
ncbi:hypothetical protein [Paracoccus sp. KR1-242]|uniref:hypothetical protein n=1 Tax=Paracoccus sp. KR1-242 TaxID=3410028 RepID=UPI003C0F2FC3